MKLEAKYIITNLSSINKELLASVAPANTILFSIVLEKKEANIGVNTNNNKANNPIVIYKE